MFQDWKFRRELEAARSAQCPECHRQFELSGAEDLRHWRRLVDEAGNRLNEVGYYLDCQHCQSSSRFTSRMELLDWQLPWPSGPFPEKEILAFVLGGHDNGAHMLGSEGGLREPVAVPVCSSCGVKTDFEFVDPALRIRKPKLKALSCTYDGYPIATDELRGHIEKLGYDVSWVRLTGTQGASVMQPTQTLEIDLEVLARERFCSACGNFYSLCGTVLLPESVTEPIPRGIYSTAEPLGSGNGKSREIVVAPETWAELSGQFLSIRSDERSPSHGPWPDLVFDPIPSVGARRRTELAAVRGVFRVSATPKKSLW